MVGYAIPMSGGAMPVYAGSRRQTGGNLFSTFARFAMPLLKKIMPHLAKLGKRAAQSGITLATGALSDAVSGNVKDIPANLKRRGKIELGNISREYLGTDIINQQTGSGKPINKRKRKEKVIRKRDRPPDLIGPDIFDNAFNRKRLSVHKE